MQLVKRILIAAVVSVMVLALVMTVGFAQEGDGRVRFVHVIPTASALDIYIDGELSITGLDFGQATEFINAPAGPHALAVTSTGLTTPLWEQQIDVAAGGAISYIASSSEPLSFTTYRETLAPLDLGKARVSVIHAIADGPNVDTLIAGNRVFPDLQYGVQSGSIDLDLNVTYEIAIVASGDEVEDAITPLEALALNSSTAYTYIVYGTASRPLTLLLSAPVSADGEVGYVRVAHGIPDAPAVDVFVDGVRIVTALEFAESSDYIAVPAGTYGIDVRLTDTETSIAGANLTVEEGDRLTAMALGSADDPALSGFADEIEDIDAESVFVTFINALPDTEDAAIAFESGASADGLEYLDAASLIFEPVNEAAAVTVTVGDEAVELELPAAPYYGGVYYTVLLVPGEDAPEIVVFDPVSIAQGITSAPGDTTLLVSEPGEDQVSAEAATPVPTEASAPAEVVEATTPPEEVIPTATTPPQTITSGPTARVVNLDPTANLRLREYPRVDANTLHLVPVGTVLLVNGREGPEQFPEGVPTPTLVAEATEFVDPGTFLVDATQDLDPATTWLNVSYETPDGGTITAWASAQFLDVRDANGEPQRLANLPLVPRNQFGVSENTSITPPQGRENRVTVVVTGINAGANLNVRRTPDTTGEVLVPLPAGTSADFVGINEARTWVFVRYVSAEGSAVTGWVNVSFVTFNYNDAAITLAEIEARGLLVITPDTEVGEVGVGVAPVSQPTRDPLRNAVVAEVTGVNSDVNLNLRRTPNTEGEVLAPVPGGSLLLVTGRTENGEWIQVTYEGQSGWVNAQYVSLTFNGTPVEISTVPLINLTPTATLPATTEPVAPTATATPGA